MACAWNEKPLPTDMIAAKPGIVLSSGAAKVKVAVSPSCDAPPSSTAIVVSGKAGLEKMTTSATPSSPAGSLLTAKSLTAPPVPTLAAT